MRQSWRSVVVCVLCIMSAVQIFAQQGTHWTNQNFRTSPETFQFAIISDVNGGERDGIFAQAVEKLNLLQPQFVICVGDLIPGYSQDPQEVIAEYDSFDARAAKMQMPFYHVPGNHDVTNPMQIKLYTERYGQTYSHFVYKNVLFLCVDTEDPSYANISDAQVAYFKQVLQDNPQVRWTFVFMHKPMWAEAPKSNWDKIETLLADRPHAVFTGHWHEYIKYDRNGHDYFTLSTTGGGSDGRGDAYGEFDHIVWVTMTPDGPVYANLMLDGIRDKNIRSEEMAKLVNQLTSGRYVTTEPVLARAGAASAVVPVHFTNPSQQPMTIRGTLATTLAGATVTPSAIDLTLAPGQTLDATYTVTGKKGIAEDVVLMMNTKETVTMLNGKPLELKMSRQMAVVKPESCPRAAAPVKLDGVLTEWGTLPIQLTKAGELYQGETKDGWSGPADASLRFSTSYDDEYLYLGIAVTDDALMADTAIDPWYQDGLEVRLDARPDPARSQGTGGNEMRDFLLIPLVPGDTAAQTGNNFRDQLPKGTQGVCVKTATGYNAEIAIPVSYLNEKQGGPWNAFRLNISLDDVDSKDGTFSQLAWKPDWRRGLNYAASGTFQRIGK